MKTIDVPAQSAEILRLLEQARDEEVLVRAEDGSEFLLSPVDDFDLEVAKTRRNQKLMEFLDRRAQQTKTIPLEEMKQQLGL